MDAKKAYSSTEFSLSPVSSVDSSGIGEYVNVYKKEINEAIKQLGVGSSIDSMDCVRDFFAMKDSEHLADKDSTRYMKIGVGFNEYQNRNPLQYVSDVKRVK